MNELARLPMVDLIRRSPLLPLQKTALIRRLRFAETWSLAARSLMLGPFPKLSEPAHQYVSEVRPAKLLALPKFGRRTLRNFEAVLAFADLSMRPVDADSVDLAIGLLLARLGPTRDTPQTVTLWPDEHRALVAKFALARVAV